MLHICLDGGGIDGTNRSKTFLKVLGNLRCRYRVALLILALYFSLEQASCLNLEPGKNKEEGKIMMGKDTKPAQKYMK